ncbi:hypothetical protein PSU4_04440 [Pseudonocardia sulfidoxydans NBRC 16205]|uniref:Uncharacterized protein n=1 Tax=Pseudonocardia sulfidoxydans NBRC 16205 TaxID=1223511 RepID=A0A511D9K4_9PSEU|nr:hypothetical protein [Pseudonocardia sulfidoxydans]GEL21490.1 hypothetical protein PSU4_04440 [Pseudonocardia sulfidoxydans NBRC 16205]
MTRRYLGVIGVAEALGVSRHAVHKWRGRHPGGSAHPFPEPDVEVDGAPGWAEDRVDEIERWRDGLPGRGAGGGRPTALQRRYFELARARGFDRAEATRTLAAFAHSFPDKTEAEICEWLVAEWEA